MSNDLSWVEWKERFEDHHEKICKDEQTGEVNGYGLRPVMEHTGEECWKESFDEGLSPEDALAEDMQYWEE
ncbi:hypothetical protein [Pseudovibrio sp. POLY-S9]|uniref:hypothetical protein n=1 Tax=Pseudovibrio sp. POLY-S9 TaxID=1576596 RepID=UPI00070A8A87|nr:hypothetical protein [Pseudovibrio sp. POLY-S9]